MNHDKYNYWFYYFLKSVQLLFFSYLQRLTISHHWQQGYLGCHLCIINWIKFLKVPTVFYSWLQELYLPIDAWLFQLASIAIKSDLKHVDILFPIKRISTISQKSGASSFIFTTISSTQKSFSCFAGGWLVLTPQTRDDQAVKQSFWQILWWMNCFAPVMWLGQTFGSNFNFHSGFAYCSKRHRNIKKLISIFLKCVLRCVHRTKQC